MAIQLVQGPDEAVSTINTTPLVDVMLVLLITIPVQLHSVNLNLQIAPPTSSPPVPPEVVRIYIAPGDVVLWNGEAITNGSTLRDRMGAAGRQDTQPDVHVRPQPGAKYERFTAVMTAANQAGLTKLGVVGSEQFLDKE
ncbi:biopolymer transporter ExbD [Roseateles asaccharophilus]|uniref:Biopolymer transport protein ExbD n=1 Tax=Roseateles asaccharophilus TaxID=582607 RepID=A0ABU2A3D5_9BURK|nr:biopolymer transporter ExbD [Roseateles asaccharophilus]MDR7331702.1 biopolymer transport protein ExbD [Roseateles asaccharophilus]